MQTFRRLGVAALLTSALLGACSSDDEPDGATSDTTAPASTSTSTSTTETTERESTGTTVSRADAIEGSVVVDREVVHEYGVSVKVKSISAEGNGIYVDIEAFNGSDTDVVLADARRLTRLFSGRDQEFDWQPPDGFTALELPVGAELEARLGFLGRLTEDDGPLLLQLGWSDDDTRTDAVLRTYPSFEFRDLPLPVVGEEG